MIAAELSPEHAIALAESGWWRTVPVRTAVAFALNTRFLCLPFDELHRLVTEALGRSVWTHEFAWPDRLLLELQGEKPPPTFSEIIGMIPPEKLLLVQP